MNWKDILKFDIQGLKQSYPAIKNLPDDAIREFGNRINDPMVNVNRLINELKQRYGVGQRPAVGRMVKEEVSKYCDMHRNPPEPIPAKEEEKMVGAVTTATPNIVRPRFGGKKRGKEEEED